MTKSEYDFKKIEEKWQKKWEAAKIFHVNESGNKKKFYVLEMFPYPSGSGLHMGHAFNYTVGDVYARFKRMQGHSVLYPMGYDSFGLPAENAAIKEKVHPKKYTETAVDNFIKQQKKLGLSYDWSRMLMTHKPEYYKWNQFFFLKFFEKGFVYRKKASVNWCPECNTVLANEQVHQGKCWRHTETEVETRQLEQWFLKITKYADELLNMIDKLDWPENIKIMQKNWIGKSYGTEIYFEVENPDDKISNVVVVHGSADNKKDTTYNKHWMPWLKKRLEEGGIKAFTPLMPEPWGSDYDSWKKEFEKLEVDENSILIGHSRGSAFLVKWLGETRKKIKKLILVAPWKIPDKKFKESFYDFKINESVKGQVRDIIIFTSNDEEDDGKKSAKIYYDALGGKVIELKNHGHFTKEDMGTEEFPELLNEIFLGKKWPIFTTRPDTIYGVTFMVVSAQHPRLMELVTEKQRKEVEKFLKKIKSVSEKGRVELEKEGIFTGSYAINPINFEKVPVYVGNFVVADYGSGMVMGVPAHDQRDFEFAKKYGIPIKIVVQPENKKIDIKNMKESYTGSGILVNSGSFNGLFSDEAKEHIAKALEFKKLGKKTVQYKLRDWLISRQRYWGTPIPVIYCDSCGIVSVPEKELPVLLPEKVSFGKGNPLETNAKFLKVKCPQCGGKGRRETDTMDTFFDSSWYYLRYCDSKNIKEPFDIKKMSYWMPVDQYIGGAEHACMHLLYARFFTKTLRDLGFLGFDEPFIKLFNQGMLHGEDGYVMSKSRGNMVLPEEVSAKYGIDTARLFLVSTASTDKDTQWNEKGIEGSLRFISKVIDYFENIKTGTADAKTESKINKTIKVVANYIENFQYNLASIKIRELFYYLPEKTSKEALEKFLKLLHPFCPHISEELWQKIGNKSFISLERWPVADEKKINPKFEKEEKIIESVINDVNNVARIIKEREKDVTKLYLYVLPNEKEVYVNNLKEIEKRTSLSIKIYSVSDKGKYDPENKTKKAKQGKPGIYLE